MTTSKPQIPCSGAPVVPHVVPGLDGVDGAVDEVLRPVARGFQVEGSVIERERDEALIERSRVGGGMDQVRRQR